MQRDGFINALVREMESQKDFFKDKGGVSSIYFGGGTPSLLSHAELSHILSEAGRVFDFDIGSFEGEMTLEVNPDDATEEYLAKLKELGFNRLSMGIQTFNDASLKWMNRRHSSAEAIESYRKARKCGFDNISLDLIFGYSGLDISIWERDLEIMCSLRPDHISAYQMSIEPGSALGKLYDKGEYSPPADEVCVEQYNFMRNYLGANGYVHYEISNFSLPGREANHNSSYWNHSPYLGLGPSAHSFDGRVRWWNPHNLGGYIRRDFSIKDDNREELSETDLFNEHLMLSLRRVSGLSLNSINHYSERLINEFQLKLDRAISKGLLIKDGDKIVIPPENLFVSDGIIGDLFV